MRSGEPPRNRTENPQIKSRNIINADRGRPQNIVVGHPTEWPRVVSFGAVSRLTLQVVCKRPPHTPLTPTGLPPAVIKGKTRFLFLGGCAASRLPNA